MRIRNINKLILVGIISLLYFLPLFADFPYEKYHVAYEEIAEDVLKNTIGILTITYFEEKPAEFRTYLKAEDRFTFEKTFNVREETTPISNFGYHPPVPEFYIYAYRYPIVNKFGRFLSIVYEPRKNLKAWVNVDEVEETFITKIAMLDSLKIPSPFNVDFFYFLKDSTRKVYKKPKEDAEYFIISKKERKKYRLLEIIGQENGFVEVGFVDHEITHGDILESVGWIPIRDDKGGLTFWLKYINLD